MIISEKSLRVADKVVEVLIQENCTVWEAGDILDEVAKGVRMSSAVQEVNYQDKFKDELKL